MQTLLAEQANLRAAWQHAIQTRQWPLIANCLNSAHYFYQLQGFFSEEAAQVDAAISALPANLAEGDAFLTGLLSRLLTARAWSHLNLAQFDEGMETAEQACKLAQRLEPGSSTTEATFVLRASVEAQARLAWGRILSRRNMHELALAQFEQVVALATTAQDPILEADGWIGIGSQILWQADVKPAQEPLHHALSLCQALKYKPGEMETLIFLGTLAQRQGAIALSLDYDKQALHLSRLLGNSAAEAEALGSLGVGYSTLGDFAVSQTYQEEALAIFRRLNMPESEKWLLGQLGYTAIQLGDYSTAERYLAQALAIARQIEDDFWQAWVKLRLGMIWHERGESDKALPLITEALQTAVQVQNPRFLAAVLYHLGNVLLGQADWAGAEQKFQKAYDLWQGARQTENALQALAGLAYVAYQQEDRATAVIQADNLWQTWQDNPVWAERANLKLYWHLGMVWQGLGDSRADDLWQKACLLLHQRSEKITDAAARKMFLEQPPVHQAILQIFL